MALLGLHSCMYKETSCAPCLTINRKTPTRKGFRKICELKRISPIRKYLLNQGTDVNPTLLYYYKSPKSLTNQGTHNSSQLYHSKVVKRFSDLNFGRSLADTTPVLS